MANEADVTFSGQAGGMNPPGEYCYPPGFGGSTEEKPVCKNIPYPYVPGTTPECNPGLLPDK